MVAGGIASLNHRCDDGAVPDPEGIAAISDSLMKIHSPSFPRHHERAISE